MKKKNIGKGERKTENEKKTNNNKYFFLQFKKSKSICEGKCLVHPIQVTGCTYCRIVFQTMYISKICT